MDYSETKRDSMCSIVSVGSMMSLDFLGTPETVLNNLDFDDDVSTDPASSEASPMKEKLMNLEFEEGGMPSRKRRADNLKEPDFNGMVNLLANLGDSSSSLFGGDDNYLPSTLEAEIMNLEAFKPEFAPAANDSNMEVERNRSQSTERRRIQSELLARLECLDGIDLPDGSLTGEQANNIIIIENDGQPQPQDQNEPKLGIYNEKQRIDRLNAYREKRKQRVYGRVRYVLRQRVSENRPRVKGRFVKQTGETSTTTPESIRQDSSANSSPASTIPGTPVRKVEFRMEPEEVSAPKRNRSAWDMFKSLSLFSPVRTTSKSIAKDKRPSLPATFSERLLIARRKSTTAASTASGKARRRFSRDEFFDEEDDVKIPQEPDRKRATSLKKWDH